MTADVTSSTTVGTADAAAKTVGQPITADTYNQMLNILEALASHNHIFYDDYTSVCECQCQCDCSRGTI